MAPLARPLPQPLGPILFSLKAPYGGSTAAPLFNPGLFAVVCRGKQALLGRRIVRYICAWGSYSWSLEGSQRISAGPWRFLVDSQRICNEFLVGFRFGWRWTQFLEVLEATGTPGKLQKPYKSEASFKKRFWKQQGGVRPDIVMPFGSILEAILGAKIVPKSIPKSMTFFMRFSMYFGCENGAQIDAKINPNLSEFSYELFDSILHEFSRKNGAKKHPKISENHGYSRIGKI